MTTDTLKELRGEVVRVFKAFPHWSAGKLKPLGKSTEIPFAGKCYVREGDIVRLRGTWVTSDQWGRQFQVDSLAYDECLDGDGLAAWLEKHAGIRGIGPVKAKRIAKEFGVDLPRMLREDPEAVALAAAVPLESITELARVWFEHEESNRIVTRLSAFGLTKNQIDALVGKFGGSIIPLVESNPYLLLKEIDGMGFSKIDGIALKFGVAKGSSVRIHAGIVEVLKQGLQGGSTCEERDALLSSAEELLTLDDLNAPTILANELDALARDVQGLSELHDEDARLYALAFPLKCERLIESVLRSGRQSNTHFADGDVDAIVAEVAGHLDPSQADAVRMALSHRICVITGGAGTGKTTVVKAIVAAYRKRFDLSAAPTQDDTEWGESTDDEDDYDPFTDDEPRPSRCHRAVVLCAPTGKAARRLEEVVGLSASTIHRLLQYHPKLGFQCDERSPITADAVIVDEVSMVASDLAFFLLRAITSRAAVVLVGDHHQLPPVGFGSVLRDTINNTICPVSVLTQCHRQAGALKVNSSAIIRGSLAPSAPKGEEGYSPWIIHDELEKDTDVLACIERLFTEILGGRYGFSMPWDVQFMSPRHATNIGTKAINVLLQRLHQKSLGVNVAPSNPEARPRLYKGDKVIQTKNNYTLNVMNGHQGMVVNAKPLIVKFDEKVVAIPTDSEGDVELGYCLTPHKMQGSEVPAAVVVCHRSHGFMLHRNWLYTAVTRAQKCCIVLGDTIGVRRAVERVEADKRRTLLGVLSKGE